jgi:hypothetical protein
LIKRRIFVVLLVVCFFISLHLLDIGDVLSDAGHSVGCNGVWCLSSYLLYHLGMYGMLLSFIILLIVYEISQIQTRNAPSAP